MFSRAIGFAPSGDYWLLAHEPWRQLECAEMVNAIATEQALQGFVLLRKHLQAASLNNIMDIVFGKRYDLTEYDNEAKELHEIVREGFELLGAFNWSDHLPWLKYFFDPFRIQERCAVLVPRVKKLIKQIIMENQNNNSFKVKRSLNEDDMVAVLWEMIFRGTDTTALLIEWVMAELVLNPQVQTKIKTELDTLIGNKGVTDADIPKLPYLNAVVKETLRLHPPGPLLSWARLSTADVHLSNGMLIPANTTAMPERFLPSAGGVNVDVRGNDLRLAPFGAGIRVCPGKNLGLATVSLWVAKLVHHFEWVQNRAQPVDLSEVLKLSSEMKKPSLCCGHSKG
ncbi:Cytochrome [Forsythia ovata]|uniref:Cytochrome n=1 Tax=Forsythia ovata TaxID=205694 RepID=A0ABD1PVK6_9LAMI